MNFKKLWSDYGIGSIIVLLFVAYGVHLFTNYLTQKSSYGSEGYSNSSNNSPPQPSDSLGQPDYSKVNYPTKHSTSDSMNKNGIQNPNDLLPSKGGSGQWSSLNPNGKGELANVSLLKAGYHIGIDTVGQTLRNANLQLRSEPPNPRNNVGPWNNATIEPDLSRPSFELGQGGQ
jgi:hypothetical protein